MRFSGSRVQRKGMVKRGKYSNNGIKCSDVVTVIREEDKIRFEINGIDQGVAFEGVPNRPLYPIACISGASSITIVQDDDDDPNRKDLLHQKSITTQVVKAHVSNPLEIDKLAVENFVELAAAFIQKENFEKKRKRSPIRDFSNKFDNKSKNVGGGGGGGIGRGKHVIFPAWMTTSSSDYAQSQLNIPPFQPPPRLVDNNNNVDQISQSFTVPDYQNSNYFEIFADKFPDSKPYYHSIGSSLNNFVSREEICACGANSGVGGGIGRGRIATLPAWMTSSSEYMTKYSKE